MKQFLLDTNVILRYLTNDVSSQAEKVKRYLMKAKEGRICVETTKIIVIEVLFQLENWYSLNRSEAADKVLTFFSPEWMGLEDKSLIFEALRIYNSIQEHSAIDCGDELNADMSSSFGGKPRSLERGGCHKSKNIDFIDIILHLEAMKLGKNVLTFDKDFEKFDPKASKTP